MTTLPLDDALTQEVLAHLGVPPAAPTIDLLDALVIAYTRAVPWESASRIARRADVTEIADYPRWPETFWQQTFHHGTGGTCFESNYAFFSLLRALGYDGYLTINNMGEQIGCHTAIVILLDGQRWLADVGMPIYLPLPFGPASAEPRRTPFQTYTVRPDGPGRYQVERTPHPHPNCFTLLDRPIPDAVYRAATTADYAPTGYFNDRVILTKVIGEEIWRFNGIVPPLMESFVYGGRADQPLAGDYADAVATRFGIDATIMRTALRVTGVE
ncbi:MAG: arylamine N-acetyltransferase [Chloroflexota bacterium]|nr:arylamine N-acetyltransferase [Chloroflexota bacterium]